MKKLVIISLVVFFLPGLAIVSYAEKEQKIKVLVEGEDEIEKGTPEEGIYIESEKRPVIIGKKKYERAKKTKELKELAEKSSIEKEIMDAIVGKIINIEIEQDRQARMLFWITAGFAIAFIIIVLVIIIREKE